MLPYAVVTLGAILLAALFFAVPLILKYHVFRPVQKLVIPGDVVQVEGRVSSTWCQGFTLETNKSKFQAFSFDHEPQVDEHSAERTVSSYKFQLFNDANEYWGFYLLKGSTVNISACSHFGRSAVTVVRGYEDLKQCVDEHGKKAQKSDSSNEVSQSESEESDEDTSSISSSQGVITNDTYEPYICSTFKQHEEIAPAFRCYPPYHKLQLKETISVKVPESDFYYFVFSTRNVLEILPNHVVVKFVFDRATFDYRVSKENCIESYFCELPIEFASEPKFVVQMESRNGTLNTEVLNMSCKPRETLFFIFYAMFFIIIFVCAFQ